MKKSKFQREVEEDVERINEIYAKEIEQYPEYLKELDKEGGNGK